MNGRLLLLALCGILALNTGGPRVHAEPASLAPVRQAIVATTRYDAAAVELAASDVQFVVTIVNSKLLEASSRARESEATATTAAIAGAIANNPEFTTIQAIHVDYVSREPDGSHARTIDAIDFRKTPQGKFEHHIT